MERYEYYLVFFVTSEEKNKFGVAVQGHLSFHCHIHDIINLSSVSCKKVEGFYMSRN